MASGIIVKTCQKVTLNSKDWMNIVDYFEVPANHFKVYDHSFLALGHFYCSTSTPSSDAERRTGPG